jgi:hypothetical protein
MARQRYLLVRVIGTRHRPHGAIARRKRLCLGHGIQKRFSWREFASPLLVVAFPIHGEGRLRHGKQGDGGKHPHGQSMNLRRVKSKCKDIERQTAVAWDGRDPLGGGAN